ncbi:MAG: FHA domain-containing protein, partial [Actinomycetes bacterium]
SDEEKSIEAPLPTPAPSASGGSEDIKAVSQESGDPPEPLETSPDPSTVNGGEGHTLAAMQEPLEEASPDMDADESESAISAPASPFGSPHEQVVPPGPSASSLTGTYDDLFGSTQIRTVEGAAVRPEEDLHEDGPRVVLEPSEPVNDPAHDGHTITMKDLLAISQGAQDPISSRREAPSVLSVLCPDQHPNTPHDATCRVCGLLIAPQEPISIPRPPLGRLAFSTGELVVIDRTALIGRSPKASGMLADGLPPEIIKVESPEKDISRTHLELRVEGWQVLAIDLDSANGTFVTVPGRAQQRLRPDAPFIIQPGSRVRLADELEFRFEVMP